MPTKLGQRLIEECVISGEQLARALTYQKEQGGKLGDCLIAVGAVTRDELNTFLCREYGIPELDLSRLEVDPELFRIFPMDVALKYRVVPVERKGAELTVAAADPTDIEALDEIRFRTGYKIEVALATEESILELLRTHKDKSPASQVDGLKESYSHLPIRMEVLRDGAARYAFEFNKKEALRTEQICNSLLAEAIRLGVTDVHYEPYSDGYRVRFRSDGKMQIAWVSPLPELQWPFGVQMRDWIRRLAGIPFAQGFEERRVKVHLARQVSKVEAVFEVSVLLMLGRPRVVFSRVYEESEKRIRIEPEPSDPFTGWPSNRKEVALTAAARRGQTGKVQGLVSHVETESRHIALLAAATHGRSECVEVLLRHGVDPKPQRLQWSALHAAAYGGHTDALRMLLGGARYGEDTGYEALELSVMEGHGDAVQILLESGAGDPHDALVAAARCGHANIVRLLLDLGLKLDLRERRFDPLISVGDRMALVMAGAEGYTDIFAMLLEACEDDVPPDTLGEVLDEMLLSATFVRRRLVRSTLGTRDALAEIRDHNHALTEIVRILLDEGADAGRCTSVIDAVAHGMSDVLRLLLEAGTDLNVRLEDGTTPLQLAVGAQDRDTVAVLLAGGAELDFESLKQLLSVQALSVKRDFPDDAPGDWKRVNWKREDLGVALSWARREGRRGLDRLLTEAGAEEALAEDVRREIRKAFDDAQKYLDLSGRGPEVVAGGALPATSARAFGSER